MPSALRQEPPWALCWPHCLGGSRWVYGVDISCMVLLLVLVGWLLPSTMPNDRKHSHEVPHPAPGWLPLLVLSPGYRSDQPAAERLALDLANGGLARAGLPEVGGGLLMGVQLVLILHCSGRWEIDWGSNLLAWACGSACGAWQPPAA